MIPHRHAIIDGHMQIWEFLQRPLTYATVPAGPGGIPGGTSAP